MWSIFKDENEYNEKAIIGFISFALMCVFGIVDLVMGIIGIELMVNDYIYKLSKKYYKKRNRGQGS
jgi:hypothetical protein